MPGQTTKPRTGRIRVTERRIRVATTIFGVAITLAAGLLALQRAGWGLVSLSYDLPFLVHRAGTNDDIRIVFLDKLDGEFLDRRPQAALLDKLTEAGARVVIYDVIFDRASDDPEIDREFAASMRRFRGVDENEQLLENATRRWIYLACGRKTFRVAGAVGETLIPPTDELLGAVDDFGLVAYEDDVFFARKLTTGSLDEPSLTWKAAQALGADLSEDSRLDTRWLNFSAPPPSPYRSCTASSLLRGDVPPGFFLNRIVVIGGERGIVGEALGKDLFATPFHRFQVGTKLPLLSGVELQAQCLDNLLRKNWLTRSSQRFDLILVIGTALFSGILFSLVRPAKAIPLALVCVIAWMTAGLLSVHFADFWFPWSVAAFLQTPVALVWGGGAHFYVERFFRLKLTEEQRALREAFAKYVSPQMLDRLTDEGFDLRIGGETVEAAVMFTDIESFTDICEQVGDPEVIVKNLNEYFERTTNHIFDHDAVVIKFIGDAIFAAWGAPFADPDAPRKAVRAAWNVFLHSKFVVRGEELRTRIGLHYGHVVAGNIGSPKHIDYTLIGDAVNLASRLEGLNKMLGTTVLLSDQIHRHIGDEFETRRVGRFRFKGRRSPTTVHELLGPAARLDHTEWTVTYGQALDALEAGAIADARTLFERVDNLRLRSGDGPSRFFLDLIDREIPIPAGVVDLLAK